MNCDYLTVTMTPESEYEIRPELDKILLAAGASAVTADLFRVGASGIFRRSERRAFVSLVASGQALQSLRAETLYDDYLSVLGSVPHRVSKMDIALDVERNAPRALTALYKKGKKGRLSLTRKSITPEKISRFLKPTPWGDDSGTVYIGSRTSEAHCKVYDKRLELHDNHGIETGTELLRYELSITHRLGASLRAAHSPSALFWHFMGDILPAPANAPVYSPGEDGGFTLAKKTELAPGEILSRKISGSPEIGLLLKLAEDCGANGLDFMLSQIRKRAAVTPVPSEAATGS